MDTENWGKKRDVIRHYDRLAEAYNSLYRDEQGLKIKAALDIIQISCSDFVLDVGCGTGFLFDHIGDSVNLIVGVDMSPGLLNVAANRSKRLYRRSSISLVRADADYLPFAREVFDKVFGLTLLQNVPDLDRALREMMRVAKEGSTIVLTGLKKSFSEESLGSILSKVGLDFSIVKSGEEVKDVIAVCRKDQRTGSMRELTKQQSDEEKCQLNGEPFGDR